VGDLRFVLQRPGRQPLDLTSFIDDTARWSTQAVGGFGSCTFSVPGDPGYWKPRIPYLSLLRITEGARVVWEGEVEDVGIGYSSAQLVTRVQAFGKARLLQASVRRMWSKRDCDTEEISLGFIGGTVMGTAIAKNADWTVLIGHFDETDPTRSGVKTEGPATGTYSAGEGNAAVIRAPYGLAFTRVKCYLNSAGADANGFIQDSVDGSTLNTLTAQTAGFAGDLDVACTSGAIYVIVGIYSTINTARSNGAIFDFDNIRLLGTSLNEDDAGTGLGPNGGFYGGTILRDLIALVPGLTYGIIESGSDFTIESIDRAIRATAQSVVDEVAGYYKAEPAVWEDGRFDWRTPDLTVPHWTARLSDLSELDLDGSVDGSAREVYVLYSDVVSGLDRESAAVDTDQANPFVKQSRTKDVLVQPGFPMTAASADKLAARLIQDQGGFVPASGRIVVPADSQLTNAAGSAQPAYAMRAGENIRIVDLPKTDLFRQGLDGETHFHIVSTETNLAQNTVELQVDAQVRRTDVLLARLALATRTVTG
jgi:hypothetical protein